MSNQDLKKVEQLFHQAVELDPAQRLAFLDKECSGKPDLRRAVERLLEHDREDEHGDSLLTSPIIRKDTTPNFDEAGNTATFGVAAPPAVPEEDAIPGYRLLDRLGYGGMGVVYKAEQLALNRLVAIKMLLSSPSATLEQLERFRTEAETLARLHHPNIVQIYEVGEWQSRPYFIMEYVAGPSLAERLDGTPQTPSSAAQLIEVLARAVHAVHCHGIIHRDLKPANILFAVGPLEEGRSRHPWSLEAQSLEPKISDFGLAKDVTSKRELTQTGQAMGTPSYMAPEQAQGRPDQIGAATDIYALGAILYELLTGRAPFAAATSAEVFARLLTEEPLPPARLLPGLPRDIETICLKCLEKDPTKRYTSAEQLAEDLHCYQIGAPIKARPLGPIGRSWRWCRRQPLAAGALATVVVLTATLIGTVLFYNARLNDALTRTQQTAEEERQHIVQLDIDIFERQLADGFAFRALLWLSDALKLDQDHPEHEAVDRERIGAVLRRAPDLLELRFYDQPVIQSRVTKDVAWVVTAGADGTVRIWDVSTGGQIGRDLRHETAVERAEFSDEGRLLGTHTRDGTVRVWEVATGRELLAPIGSRETIRKMAFVSNERLVIQRSGYAVELLDLKNRGGATLQKMSANTLRYSLVSEDGSRVFTVDDRNRARLLEVSTAAVAELPWTPAPGEIRGAFSSDGRRLALCDTSNVVWLWDVSKRAWLGEPLKQSRLVSHLGFSPRADRVLIASGDGMVLIVGAGERQPPILLPRHESAIEHAQFSSDGRRVLTACGKKACVWDSMTGASMTPSLTDAGQLTHARFDPDGRRILIAESPGHVRVWRMEQTAEVQSRLVNLDASHLALLAQVLSGERIDESGSMWPLSEDDLRRAWMRLRPRPMP
jgi:serine/threonine protein kinase/WD40 repeat protein